MRSPRGVKRRIVLCKRNFRGSDGATGVGGCSEEGAQATLWERVAMPGGRVQMSLSEQEREALSAAIREELEEEHARREEQAQARRQHRRSSRQEAHRKEREAEELRNALRRQFYEENGYRQATDHTGREIWLSPAEYTLRTRKSGASKRRRRGKRRFEIISPRKLPRLRDALLFVLMCGAAVGIGLLLAN